MNVEGPKKTKEWWQYYSNVYFYLTMPCVRKNNKDMMVQEVTMAVDTFTLLMPKHLCFLHQKGS